MNIPRFISLLALAAGLIGSRALCAPATDSVNLGNWQTAQGSTGWKLSDSQAVSFVRSTTQPSYLHIVSPSTAPKDESAEFTVPITQLRGTIIRISVEIRASGVTKPSQAYNGIKAMLHVQQAGGVDTWDQAAANGATFPVSYGWSAKAFETRIPEDATGATLVLGLQQSAGVVDFRDVQMTIVGTVPRAPLHEPKGPVYTGHGPGALRGVMTSPNIQPSDVATLKAWHVNVIRWQILWTDAPKDSAVESDTQAYDAWLATNLHRLDVMLPVFQAAGIRVVVDMHSPPGGRTPDGSVNLFTEPALEQHLIDCWAMIAKRYRDNRAVWGYDLMNEPVVGNIAPDALDWHGLAEAIADRIRTIDTRHALIVEPAPWAEPNALQFFAPLKASGVVYSVHFYDPHQFTHQGVMAGAPIGPVYPGVIDGVLWNKSRIRASLQPAEDYAKMFHVSIYLGEFSAVRWAKGASQYIADVISVAEENHWDWTYHAFREWQGWSPEIGSDPNSTAVSATPTDRLRVLQAAFAKNTSAR